jgi:hypothetical protein
MLGPIRVFENLVTNEPKLKKDTAKPSKIVRGAHMEKENERAAEKGYIQSMRAKSQVTIPTK